MKKILLITLLSLFVLSCEEDKDYISGSDSFIAFSDMTLDKSVAENSGTVTLRVGLSRVAESDVTVSFATVDDTAIEGTHYSLPASIIISAGEQFADLVVTLIDDSDLNTKRVFELQISSVSDSSYAVGIGDTGSYRKYISILNDDCPTKFSYWVGNLDVEDVGYGSTPGTGGANADGDCDILVVNNNLPGASSPVNSTYVLEFTSTSIDGTTGTVSVQPTQVRQEVSGGVTYDAKYAATGTYDSVAGTITLNYQYRAYNAAGNYVGNFWTGTNVITLQ